MHIIIVDDDPVSLAVIKQLVTKLPNCDAHDFTNALPALAACAANPPDLVIVDYMMPEIDGIEFTRRLRASSRIHMPVVMVSIANDRELIKRALRNGVDDFLSKPFDFVQLQTCVTNILGLRAPRGQLANRALLLDARALASTGGPRDVTVKLLDRNMTRARLGGDEKLLADIARIFIRTVPRVMSDIRSALMNSDLAGVLEYVSALRGSVAALEAPDVSDLLFRLETHARNGDGVSTVAAFAMAQAVVERLLRELAPLVSAEIEAETEIEVAPAQHERLR